MTQRSVPRRSLGRWSSCHCHATRWAMRRAGPCDALGHAMRWAMRCAGPCDALGHAMRWAMRCAGPCDALGHALHWGRRPGCARGWLCTRWLRASAVLAQTGTPADWIGSAFLPRHPTDIAKRDLPLNGVSGPSSPSDRSPCAPESGGGPASSPCCAPRTFLPPYVPMPVSSQCP
jgi:hypothetical protein